MMMIRSSSFWVNSVGPSAMAAVSHSAKRAKVALEPHTELPVESLESNGAEIRQP
jgi:hypothetical protein